MLLGAGMVLLTAFANAVVTYRTRLIGLALLTVPQLWVPGLPAVALATLAVLWTLVTCLSGLAMHGRSSADSFFVFITGLFVAVTAVSLAWALPSGIDNGAATVARGTIFVLWLREVVVLARDEPGLLDTIVLWLVPGVALQSGLTIVFRVRPALEEQFLRSDLAAIVVGPQAKQLYTGVRNNVLYADKAGGLFVNGNVASLFSGLAAILLVIVARRTARRWLYAIAALAAAAVAFSGSKTGLVVGAGCVVVVAFVPPLLKRGAALVGFLMAVLVPLTLFATTELLERFAPGFRDASEASVAGREPLWRGATQLFWESPVLGLGFCGWTEEMARFTNRPDLPPHNLIIAAWAYSGLLAALLAIVFMIAAIAFGLRVATSQPNERDRRTVVLAIYALVWVFSHGMGDNTTIYGEQRSMILVALFFGYLYAMELSTQNGVVESEGGDDFGHRGVLPTTQRLMLSPTAKVGMERSPKNLTRPT